MLLWNAATRLLVHGDADPTTVIVRHTVFFWFPLTPVFMFPNSASIFNFHLRLEGKNIQLGKSSFLSHLSPLNFDRCQNHLHQNSGSKQQPQPHVPYQFINLSPAKHLGLRKSPSDNLTRDSCQVDPNCRPITQLKLPYWSRAKVSR